MEHICKLATFGIKIMDLHIVVLEVMSMQTDAIWQILPESIKEALKRRDNLKYAFSDLYPVRIKIFYLTLQK